MKIAIRVDASQVIGTGHVRRSLALAHALQDAGAVVRFVTRDLGSNIQCLIEAEGFRALVLAAPDSPASISSDSNVSWGGEDWARDAADTIAALGDWLPDWIVVDHYSLDAKWHLEVRDALKCQIAAIDDLGDRALAVDIVIDHNYAPDHHAKYTGRLITGAKILGGPRYALLGPAFAGARWNDPQDVARSIGIFMGGVDNENISAVALEAIAYAGFDGAVEIVTTSGNPNLADLRELIAGIDRITLSVDLPDLAAFFARHDIQLGAGGGASWERCCIGAPTVLLVVADNQLAVVPGLAELGAILSPLPLGTLEPEAIAMTLRLLLEDAGLRKAVSLRARSLVDGLGARRVALHMLARRMRVRPAIAEDARLMHAWRNHPETRAVSRSSEEIGWDDHLTWLGRVLTDPDKALMIGMMGDVPIGVIRLDRLEAGRAEVSLYLDPTLHGLGLGGEMLRAAEATTLGTLDILAEVKEENASSARMFESAGYVRISATHWIKSAEAVGRRNERNV